MRLLDACLLLSSQVPLISSALNLRWRRLRRSTHNFSPPDVDTVAPLQSMKLRTKPEPVLNENGRRKTTVADFERQYFSSFCSFTPLFGQTTLHPVCSFRFLTCCLLSLAALNLWLRLPYMTQPALSRVFNDGLLPTGSADCEVLLPLDLTAVFERLDHRCSGWVLRCSSDWLRSYLTDFFLSVSADMNPPPLLS